MQHHDAESPSVLQHLVTLVENSSLPKDCILGITQTFLVAGIETVREALIQYIRLLATHPDIQKKIKKEIDRVVGLEDMPELRHKDQLPLLNAAILETLRFVTVVPMVRRLIASDVSVNGCIIPKGTQVKIQFRLYSSSIVFR